MTQRIQHRRVYNTASGWPVSIMSGEVVVNPVRRRLAVGDTNGSPVEVTSVPWWDVRSSYAVGEIVNAGAALYRCKIAIPTPHAWNPAEWENITFAYLELQSAFDTRYSLTTHNHSGTYSLVSHLHDDRYSLLGHTHSGVYAPATHNHDGVYAKLSGGNSFGAGVNTFADVVNLGGSYTAVYGLMSIAGAYAAFVPDCHLHVRGGGMTIAKIETYGLEQVRLELKHPYRDYILYVNGDGSFVSMYDLSASTPLVTMYPGGVGTAVAGWLSASTYVSTPRLTGGPGGSGTLTGYGGNNICFRWAGGDLYYRIDEITEHKIAATEISMSYRGPGATDFYLNLSRIPYTADGTLRNFSMAVSANMSPGPVP